MSAFVPIIEAPDENRGLFGIIGSNTSLTAVFGSDTPETYTHYYAESGGDRSGSNFGFLVGVSNELFTIRPRPEGPEGLEGSNGAAASAVMASNGFFGLGTDDPKERLHVAGNMVLDGKIFDSFGTELIFGGGSWRKLADDSDYHPAISAPATGVFEMTCNVILQRYIGNDMTLNLNIDGTVITRPTAQGGDYTMNLPVLMDTASYPIETTVGELWLSASSNNGSGPGSRTIFKALAKSIPGSNESIALRYLTGTTEVSLANINSSVDISLQGIVRYQTVLYNKLGPDDSITIPGDQMKWMPVREPHPMFEAPFGASSTTLTRQGLMRYLGDELIYRVLFEATLDSQPSPGVAGSLDYTISLEYPIAPQAYINSNAIVGDLWLTVINGTTATNFKAYARTVDGDTSKVAIRFLNGTFDQSLAEIDAGSTIRIQGNVVYKAEQVASLAIPRAYLPNNLYQDDDGNVALNNYGRPMRARFEIIETSNLPALIVDQHSDADIAQFRSNVDDIKLIIDSRGHIGVGTTVAPYPFTVKGGMLFDGTMYDATGNAIWIPGSSVNWKATATAPVITVPTGGVWTQLPGAAKGIWRYMGNEINYNVTISGVLSAAPTDTEDDFRLSVPYPVNQTAYLPESIIGDLWADVAYGANSNTFKAYARPDPVDSNQVRLRVLSGTKDDSLATLLAGSALTIKGEVKYSTTGQVQSINPYGTYDPLDLQQDVSGQVILNGYGNLPRGRLDIVSGPDASNSNTLVLDQRGSGKSLIVMNQGIPKTAIDSAGNLGLGTTTPAKALDVRGNAVFGAKAVTSANDATRAIYITPPASHAASNIAEIQLEPNAISRHFLRSEPTAVTMGGNTTIRVSADDHDGSSSNVFEVRKNNANALVIAPTGDVLPGQTNVYNLGSQSTRWKNVYTSNLETDAIRAQNIIASGLLTASNIRVLGDYVILDTITSNTEQMVITNDGTGPALKVTQTGANSIAEFYDDGNALAFKVANDGLVGIGTATPLQKLHVVGSALVSSNLVVSGGDIKTGAAVASTLFPDTTTGSIAIGGALSTGTVTLGATGSTGAISMFPSTVSQAITLGGATTGLITLGSTAATAVQLPTGKTKVGQTTLVQGGAVSVTLPAAAGTLLIVENALTSGSATAGFLKYNGTTAAAGQLDGGTTTPTGTTRLNYGGYIYPTSVNVIGTADTTTAATHYFVETGSDGFVRPKTLANARTELVTNAAVNLAAATTVGTISSGIWNAGALTSSSTVSAGTQFLAPSGDLVGAPGFSWTGNTGTGIYRPAVNEIGLVTNGGERIRVSATGNVGIGTASPQTRLHIYNGVYGDSTGQPDNDFLARIHQADNSSLKGGLFVKQNWAAESSSVVEFGNDLVGGGAYASYYRISGLGNHVFGGTPSVNRKENMRITASGNVGIGTTNPQQKLHISGGNLTHLMLETTVNGAPRSCGITFRAANSTIANPTGIYLDEADGIGVYAYGTTPRIYLPYTGNVGIGTTNPQSTLHVNGIVSGNGIKFPTSQIASSDPNTLDDYEEGTWTPSFNTVDNNLTGFTYLTRTGTYTKIGRLVTISCELSTSTSTSISGTGALIITGTPYPLFNPNSGRNTLALTHDNRWTNCPSFAQLNSSGNIHLYKTSTMATPIVVGDMAKASNSYYNIVSLCFSYETT